MFILSASSLKKLKKVETHGNMRFYKSIIEYKEKSNILYKVIKFFYLYFLNQICNWHICIRNYTKIKKLSYPTILKINNC